MVKCSSVTYSGPRSVSQAVLKKVYPPKICIINVVWTSNYCECLSMITKASSEDNSYLLCYKSYKHICTDVNTRLSLCLYIFTASLSHNTQYPIMGTMKHKTTNSHFCDLFIYFLLFLFPALAQFLNWWNLNLTPGVNYRSITCWILK